MDKATTRIKQCLDGDLPYSELTKFEKSALSIHIYFRASAMLDLSREDMAKAGQQLPPDIRDLVRDECKRLLEYRRLERNGISQRKA